MMGEPQELYDRLACLLHKANTMAVAARLDLADEAERLFNDATRVFHNRPADAASSVVRLIGEKAAMIANVARSRV